jgi:hypothetical protein
MYLSLTQSIFSDEGSTMRTPSTIILVAILLSVGLAVGGWRFLRPQAQFQVGDHVVEIPLVTTEDKADWIRSQVFTFNEQNFRKWHITVTFLDSRVAMQHVLAGKLKPVLWSPDNPLWINRLSQVWQSRTGQALANLNDASSFHVFLRTPVVFLTTQGKARYLRPVLGKPGTWEELRQLSMGHTDAPWGRIRFSHADPITSNCGMLTMGMILNEYAREHGGSGNLAQCAQSVGFAHYLGQMERGLVHTKDSSEGSFAVAKSFIDNSSSMDFVATYESVALTATSKNKNLAVIYPNPTVVSQQSMTILNGPWLTADQRAGAVAFMEYVNRDASLQAGMRYNMRSDGQSGNSTLTPKLRRFGKQGFQETFTAEDLPSYDALNTAAYQWLHTVRHNNE